jgi:hypothetical protein
MPDIQVNTAVLVKALVLCNESRNRLTRFNSTPDFWILEAHAELYKTAAPVPTPETQPCRECGEDNYELCRCNRT